MSRLFAGIDPGTTGAVALYDPESGHLNIFDIPFFEVKSGSGTRKKIDILSLIDLLEDIGDDVIEAASLESVSARPHDGKVQAFAFGEAFGSIKGCLAAARVPYELVTPQTWKKEFRLNGKGDDGADAAREAAMRLLPDHAHLFKRKMDHNRADAALLAIYTARLHRK